MIVELPAPVNAASVSCAMMKCASNAARTSASHAEGDEVVGETIDVVNQPVRAAGVADEQDGRRVRERRQGFVAGANAAATVPPGRVGQSREQLGEGRGDDGVSLLVDVERRRDPRVGEAGEDRASVVPIEAALVDLDAVVAGKDRVAQWIGAVHTEHVLHRLASRRCSSRWAGWHRRGGTR